jgi:hypothetical protein
MSIAILSPCTVRDRVYTSMEKSLRKRVDSPLLA